MGTSPKTFGILGVLLLLCAGLAVGPGCGTGGSEGGDAPQTGRAVLGPLAGATVRIYEMRPGATFELRFTETTNGGTDLTTAGTFDAHREALEDGRIYLVKVTGGQDLDADDDGVLDASPTPNNGSIHAVGTGAQLKAGLFQVNVLTEIAYQGVLYLLSAGYEPDQIVDGLDTYADYLLLQDVNGDAAVTSEDLLAWDPVLHAGALRKHISHYGNLVDAIRADDKDDLRKEAAKLSDVSIAFASGAERVEDVVTSGNYAYVSVHDDGLEVYDISNPGLPARVATLDTNEADGLDLVGTLLYVADDDGVQIVDVSDPTAPFLRGKAFGPGGDEMEWCDDVVVSGDYAFAVDGEDGCIRIIDVSDPDAPYLAETYKTWQGFADGIALYGDYVLVACGDGLTVIDVTDPLNPHTEDTVENDGDADRVVVQGNYAYVAGGDEAGMWIVDLTDPENPDHEASVEAPMDCEGIAVFGIYVYLSQRDAGVQVIDVSDPLNPTTVGTCTMFGEGNDLCCHGDYILVATEDDGGLRIFDVNPHSADLFADAKENPVVSELTSFNADDVVTDGRYAYVASPDGVTSLDLLDPVTPVVLDTVSSTGDMDGESTRVAMQGDLLYLTLGYNGLQIVDVSAPAAMSLRGHYDGHLGPQEMTRDVCVLGSHAYTAEVHGPRFLAIDATNPDDPAFAGDNYDYGHGLRGVAPLGANHVCTAWGFAGIRVLDVSDPTDPTVVGGDTLPHVEGDWHDASFVGLVRTNGNYAYVPYGEGMWIVDASDPENVVTPGHLDGPEAFELAFAGSHVYMACRARGLAVADVADPANPYLVTRLPLVGNVRGIAVMGDYLLVANGDRFTVIRRPLVDSVP